MSFVIPPYGQTEMNFIIQNREHVGFGACPGVIHHRRDKVIILNRAENECGGNLFVRDRGPPTPALSLSGDRLGASRIFAGGPRKPLTLIYIP